MWGRFVERRHATKNPALEGRGTRSQSPKPIYLPAVASCEEMLEKVLLSWEPSVLTTVMMATEMPAAIRPYSIAVAPDLSFFAPCVGRLRLIFAVDNSLKCHGSPIVGR